MGATRVVIRERSFSEHLCGKIRVLRFHVSLQVGIREKAISRLATLCGTEVLNPSSELVIEDFLVTDFDHLSRSLRASLRILLLHRCLKKAVGMYPSNMPFTIFATIESFLMAATAFHRTEKCAMCVDIRNPAKFLRLARQNAKLPASIRVHPSTARTLADSVNRAVLVVQTAFAAGTR
jgi:hypothetical protein